MSHRRELAEAVRMVATAAQLTTRLPLRLQPPPSEGERAAAVVLFPAVGVLCGVVAALVGGVGVRLWSSGAGAVLAIACLLVLSGGMMLDGLAHTADAAFHRGSVDSRVLVLRERSLNANGVAAVALTLLLEVGLLAQTPPELWLRSLLVATMLSRWSMGLAMVLSPTRGDGEGLAASAAPSPSDPAVRGGGLLVVLLAVVVLGWRGLGAALLTSALVVVFGSWTQRWLGPLHAESFGALGELSFMLALLVASVGQSI